MAMAVRRLGWTRNPLRRGTDRIEGWLHAALVVALLAIGAPLAWHLAGSSYRAEERAAAWDRAHRHQVWAVLLEKPAVDTARARWTGPDLSVRVGPVTADPRAAAGSWTPLWVDDEGRPAAAPREHHPAVEAGQVAVTTVLILATVLGGVSLIARKLLDRRRLRAWQAEWTEVGPRWSRYR